MHILIRDLEGLESINIDTTRPVFLDTETGQDKGETKGGLYGNIRLFQIYQKGWPGAIIVDCLFVPLQKVLDLLLDEWCVFHNGSYDIHTINLYTEELWVPKRLDDTIYLSRFTFFQRAKFGFYECLTYAKLNDDIIRAMDKKASQKADWNGPLSKELLNYAEYDVTYLAKLWDVVSDKAEHKAYKLDMFNLKYAFEYSRRGIPIDEVKVNNKLREVTVELEKVLDTLPVNPNSPKQCKELLGTSSSDMDTLVHLKLKGNEMAGMIRDARQLSKTRMFLMKYSRPIIKGFYNPCAAISGRFSCTGGDRFDHDNLQQIPRRLLELLMASEGRCLVYKDYSSLELRMAVAWVGEPTMERLMRDGVDLHTYTGCIIYGVTPETITKIQRMIGKILNFSLVYGAYPATVQAMLRSWGGLMVPIAEVREICDNWFEEYHYFAEWHDMNKKHLDVYGYLDIETCLGRKIRTYKINDALNFPIQGSSSEVTKTSHYHLKTRYPTENLISTIHDSNTLMPLIEEEEYWIDALNECMVDAWFDVTKDLAIPDLPMPAEAEASLIWDF